MTSSFIKESAVEEVVLEYLRELGYRAIAGPEIAPDMPESERTGFDDVVLEGRLRDAIERLNPDLPIGAIDEVGRVMRRVESQNLSVENARFHQLITEGVRVRYRDRDGKEVNALARVIDFDHQENNDFLAVNQFTVIENRHNRRPDIVLFVNGLPLVVFELKNPGDENATVKGAWNQLQTYENEIPSLFLYNAVQVVSDGLQARMGTLTGAWEHFAPWKALDSDELAPSSIPALEVLIRGVFAPERFLDLLRSYIAVSDESDGIVKRVAKYHQYWAVRQAISSTVRAAGEGGDRRAGVIWHTQGSGKSFEALLYTTQIMRSEELENPTVVVVTDRNDLDDQLFDEVFAPSRSLPESPVQAESRDHLKQLLSRVSGGVIFTTMQKFGVNRKGDQHPELTDRRNVVVITDEAHRSQYGFLDGFARHIRDALPNATFLGFTGTPIDLEGKSTRQVFGDYISVYDITQSVEDGATVRIYYESRLAKVALGEELDVDEEFDEVTETEEEPTRERLRSKWSRLEAIAGAEGRIDAVARDIVEHWEERRETLFGKGMIVAMSRRIAVELYEAIIKLRPEWHSDKDEDGRIKVVMTGSASDPLSWQQHIRTKERRRNIGNRMKESDDPMELIIVRDMFLTGFDAPALHTMYVDKPMRGHNLMQAIARVNRTFRDKPGGLIVDYIGIATNLQEALAAYSKQDRDSAGIPLDVVVKKMLEKHEVVTSILHDVDWSGARSKDDKERLSAFAATVDFVLSDPDRKQRYLDESLALIKAFTLAVPHPKTIDLRDDVGFFQGVRSQILKLEADGAGGGPTQEDLDSAINQIVSGAVAATGVIDIYSELGIEKPEISLLTDEFLAGLQGDKENPNLRMAVLRKLLNDEIRTIRRRNVVQYRLFSDRLQDAILGYQNRNLTTAEVIAKLVELAKEIRDAHQRGDDLGLNDDEIAFYDAVFQNDSAVLELGDDILKEIASELVRRLRKRVTIDWSVKQTARAAIRSEVRILLANYDYPPDKAESAVDLVLEQTELFAQHWAENAA